MKTTLLLIAGSLIATTVGWAIDPTQFRYRKPIDRGAARNESLVACALDSDIFAATRDGFPDLRVFSDSGIETPFEIERVSETREQLVRQTHTPKVLELKEEGNSIDVRLQLDKDVPPAEGISIVTPLKDFERKVRVFGSADGTEWALLKEAVVFDYSRYMDVRNTEVALPVNAARQLKVVIDNVTDEKESPYLELTRSVKGGEVSQRQERVELLRRPFRMDRISTWHNVKQKQLQQAKTASYPPVRFSVENDADKKQTRVGVETRREPLTSFTLETPSRNFHRRITVEVPAPTAPRPGAKPESTWNQIAAASISRIGLQKADHEHLKIAIPESRQNRYRLVIHNEDSPPLEITGVAANGVVYRLVFLAQQNQSYQVAFGSASMATPAYDATTVLAALRRDNAPIDTPLGPRTEAAGFAEPAAPGIRGLFNNWIFLGSMIGLMVVVLGWTLFRAGRRIGQLPNGS